MRNRESAFRGKKKSRVGGKGGSSYASHWRAGDFFKPRLSNGSVLRICSKHSQKEDWK